MKPTSSESGKDAVRSSRLVYGFHAVEDSLHTTPERVLKIWIAYGRSGRPCHAIRSLARDLRVPVAYAERKVLDRQAGSSAHQGIVALLAGTPPVSLEEIMSRERPDKARLLLMLDGMQDPRNLGAILRTADAAGIDGILIPRYRNVSITPAVAKAAAGAAEAIPLAIVTNAAQTVQTLQSRGIWVYGADPQAETTYADADFARDVCIVVGGEGKGLRPLVKKRCDLLIGIPHHGRVTSLNVSVATGILLYEALRQRRSRLSG